MRQWKEKFRDFIPQWNSIYTGSLLVSFQDYVAAIASLYILQFKLFSVHFAPVFDQRLRGIIYNKQVVEIVFKGGHPLSLYECGEHKVWIKVISNFFDQRFDSSVSGFNIVILFVLEVFLRREGAWRVLSRLCRSKTLSCASIARYANEVNLIFAVARGSLDSASNVI